MPVAPLIDAATLTYLIALDESAMPDTCSVVTAGAPVINDDGSGGSGATTARTYPCRIAPLGASPVEQVFASRLGGVTGFVVSLPWNAAVSERDTIVAGTQTYQCIGVLNPTSYQTAVHVVCKRLT
jgi:hypothetical protein